MLQTAWDSDQLEMVASEKSWNLQGWLSVGTHKLVQQTLRALVRTCSHPYAVRGNEIVFGMRDSSGSFSHERASSDRSIVAEDGVLYVQNCRSSCTFEEARERGKIATLICSYLPSLPRNMLILLLIPLQVRNVLWEARQAAEFAAAARAAASSQRAEDSRGLSGIRRERKKMVRQHKRNLLLVRQTNTVADSIPEEFEDHLRVGQ